MEEKPVSIEICKEEFSEDEKQCYQRFLEEVMRLVENRAAAGIRGPQGTEPPGQGGYPES